MDLSFSHFNSACNSVYNYSEESEGLINEGWNDFEVVVFKLVLSS